MAKKCEHSGELTVNREETMGGKLDRKTMLVMLEGPPAIHWCVTCDECDGEVCGVGIANYDTYKS